MLLNNKKKEIELDTSECPYLIEWTGWTISFCKHRYQRPDVLTAIEIRGYCKSNKYSTCHFFNVNAVDIKKGELK